MIYMTVIAFISYWLASTYLHIQTGWQMAAVIAVCVIIFFTPMSK